MTIGERIARIESPRFEVDTVDTIITGMIDLARILDKWFKSKSDRKIIAERIQPLYLERIDLAMGVLLSAENGNPLYNKYPEINKTVLPAYIKIRNMINETHGLRETEG